MKFGNVIHYLVCTLHFWTLQVLIASQIKDWMYWCMWVALRRYGKMNERTIDVKPGRAVHSNNGSFCGLTGVWEQRWSSLQGWEIVQLAQWQLTKSMRAWRLNDFLVVPTQQYWFWTYIDYMLAWHRAYFIGLCTHLESMRAWSGVILDCYCYYNLCNTCDWGRGYDCEMHNEESLR